MRPLQPDVAEIGHRCRADMAPEALLQGSHAYVAFLRESSRGQRPPRVILDNLDDLADHGRPGPALARRGDGVPRWVTGGQQESVNQALGQRTRHHRLQHEAVGGGQPASDHVQHLGPALGEPGGHVDGRLEGDLRRLGPARQAPKRVINSPPV
jgi:hypothetical protein